MPAASIGGAPLSPELAAELAAADHLPQKSIDAFLAAGVSPGALAFDADGYLNPLHLAHVVFGFEGRFEFARHQRAPVTDELCRAFVFLARDLDGEPADIVAWSPKRAMVALWLGNLPMLGMEQAGPYYDMARDTLAIHADIEAWLKVDRVGGVIFDHRGAAPWLHLARPLLVSTPIAGAVLREALTIPAPRIMVGEIAA